MEMDLSLKKQFLDVVVIRKRRGRFNERLPDGLDDLADHNLITFKSHQEALDDWALKELTGHYVNYRKQLSPAGQPLLPETAFRLYAVCSRFPHHLAQMVPWESLREGVYQCRRGSDAIRVVVAGQLPQTEHNALLHLFSASIQQVSYGQGHYRARSADTTTLIHQLLRGYAEEGLDMPYSIEQVRRDYAKEHFKDLTPEEQLELLKTLSPEERLAGLPPEERLAGLPPEQRLAGLPPEQRLAGLPPEQVEEMEQALQRLKAERSSPPKKKRRR
jgi:hypothetical protein